MKAIDIAKAKVTFLEAINVIKNSIINLPIEDLNILTITPGVEDTKITEYIINNPATE